MLPFRGFLRPKRNSWRNYLSIYHIMVVLGVMFTLYIAQVCGHTVESDEGGVESDESGVESDESGWWETVASYSSSRTTNSETTQSARNCPWHDNHGSNRLAEDGPWKPLTSPTVTNEWGKSFMDVMALKTSSGQVSAGRWRGRRATQLHATQHKMKLYHNLCLLIMDVLDAFGLKFLTIYTREHLGIIVPWLSYSSGVMWNISPCSFSASTYVAPRKQGLSLVLCDHNSTLYILSKAATGGGLHKHVWLVAGLRHSLVSTSPQLYIPIDSMVVEVTSTEDTFHLHEIWSPQRGTDLHQVHLASWQASLRPQASPEASLRQQASPEASLRQQASPKARSGPLERTVRPEPGTTVGRLTLSRRPKYERRRDLTGVHFVVTSINDERAHNSRHDPALGRQVMSGYFGDVWEVLKSELNFTYTVITPTDGEYGSYRDGTWTGMIGDVLSGRAHVVVAHLSQTYSRAQVIDFSSVLIKLSYRIFARAHERSAVSWTVYTRPFSTNLWVGLVLTLLLLAAVYAGVSHCYSHWNAVRGLQRDDNKYREWKRECPLLVWAAITQQGWPTSPDAGALRMLFWMMYVIGVVVVASYSATLVSFLTVVNDQLPFQTLEDLKNLPKFRLGIQKGSVLEELFKNHKFLEYWETLIEPYSNTVVQSYSELRALTLKNTDYAYVGSLEVQRLVPVGTCTIKPARQHLLFNDGALGWPQGSPYLQLFDHFINKLRESGLLKKLKDVWYPRPYACSSQPVVALGLLQVLPALVLLGLGAGLSLVFLGLEKLLIHCTSQHTQIQE